MCDVCTGQMGYALGRIETRPENNLPFMPPSPPHYFGHVASVAVHEYYRGNGVGKGLIEKLHEEFGTTFQLDEASLYCRVSLSSIPFAVHLICLFHRHPM